MSYSVHYSKRKPLTNRFIAYVYSLLQFNVSGYLSHDEPYQPLPYYICTIHEINFRQ